MERSFTAHETVVMSLCRFRDAKQRAIADKPSVIPPSIKKTQKSRLRNPIRLNNHELCGHVLELIGFMMIIDDDHSELSLDALYERLRSTYGVTQEEVGIMERFMKTKNSKKIIIEINKMRLYYRSLLDKASTGEILAFFRMHMKPMLYEKKNKGMVFTPLELIDDLLDRLPDHVWSNPHNIFIDPSAGMGGFLWKIYERLMKRRELVHRFPNEQVRRNHIISNMLLAVELDDLNVDLLRRVFGPNLRIHKGDALTLNPMQAFGCSRFTCIVGNPPFESMQTKDVKRNAGDSLWPRFVKKALEEWMEPAGCFAMLLPPGWRKPASGRSRNTGLMELMTVKNKITHLEVYDAKRAKEAFEGNVAIQFDLVNIQGGRSSRQHETNVKGVGSDAFEKVKLYGMPFITNGNLAKWRGLLLGGVGSGGACKVHYSRSALGTDKEKNKVKDAREGEFIYPVVNSIHKNGEPTFKYSSTRPREGGFGVSKIIFNQYGAWNKPMLDMEGRFGMTQNAFCLEVSSRQEADRIMRFFHDEDMLKMFNQDLKWGTSVQHAFWKLFHYLPHDFYNRF